MVCQSCHSYCAKVIVRPNPTDHESTSDPTQFSPKYIAIAAIQTHYGATSETKTNLWACL